MSHSPKDIFDFSIARAKHLIALYDILHNSRQRNGRSDWLAKFKSFMHWPKGENVVRIDGKDKNSLLILREALGITSEHFAHDYVSELLRSSVVNAVSALDRYFHDLVLSQSWALLSKKEDDIPKALKNLPIPALSVKKALESLRKDPKARPGNLLKKDIQSMLHKEYTFQSSSNIDNAIKLLGISDFWATVGKGLGIKAGDVQNELNAIARRRNQIVHEADVTLKTKGKIISLRDISRTEAEQMISFIESFVVEVEKIAV